MTRNDALRAAKCLCRALLRRWSGWHYHRRGRAATNMLCVKLLVQEPLGRDLGRQFAKLQVRVAVLNGYASINTIVAKAVE